MRRKLIILAAACALTIGVITGCGAKDSNNSATSPSESADTLEKTPDATDRAQKDQSDDNVMDDAVDGADDVLDDAVDGTEDVLDDAGDAVKDAGDAVKDTVDDGTDSKKDNKSDNKTNGSTKDTKNR